MAYPVVSFENDESACCPVWGESLFAGAACPGALMFLASALSGDAVVAVGFEAGGWCEHGCLKISYELSSVG